jgi:hypothetical protein
MGIRKITPRLEVEILTKATEGASTRAIAQWLRDERGVTVSHQAVANLLRQTRQTRAEVAKVVVREQLAKTVLSDLDRLDRSLRKIVRVETRAHNLAIHYLERLAKTAAVQDGPSNAAEKRSTKNLERAEFFVDAALKATDRVRTLVVAKLHYSGADGADDEGELGRLKKGAGDELLSRLDVLADRAAGFQSQARS